MRGVRLQDVCEFIVDCPHSTAVDEGEGYPLIRTPNIGKGRLVLEGVHRVSESVYQQRIARGTPQDGDLIFAREAPAGNVAIVKNGEKVCLGQRTVLLRPDKEKVVPEYLVYYLLSPKQQYGLLGTANGATVAHVNLPTIRELPVELPHMDIQRRIADILSAYDDLIENNQKQIKLLEEAAQRLYREWFMELRFPGHETTPVVDGVPEGWTYKRVKDFGEIVTGKTPSTGDANNYGSDVPFVTIPDMHEKVFPIHTSRCLSIAGAHSQKNKYIPAGSIMVSCIATIGLVCIAPMTCQTNQQINSVVPHDESTKHFLYFAMKNIDKLLDGLGSNGATMTNVTKMLVGSGKIVHAFPSTMMVHINT